MAWREHVAVSMKELLDAYCQQHGYKRAILERGEDEEPIFISLEWHDPLNDGKKKYTLGSYLKLKVTASLTSKKKTGKTEGQPGFLREEIEYIGISQDRKRITVRTPNIRLEQDPGEYNYRELQEIVKYINCGPSNDTDGSHP